MFSFYIILRGLKHTHLKLYFSSLLRLIIASNLNVTQILNIIQLIKVEILF